MAERILRVFGYLRFSYAGRSDARTSRSGEPVEVVAQTLFEAKRMERRFFLFENLCLPSLKAQTNQNFRLCVLASEDMPQVFKDRLQEVTASVPQIEVLYSSADHVTVPFNDWMEKAVAGSTEVAAHFRLDDDDALGQSMIARLEAATALAPMVRVVSWSRGLYLTHQDGTAYLLREHFPFIGIGMAFLNQPGQILNPYQCKHVQVSSMYPAFVDPGPAVWIHSAHGSSDTMARQDKKFRSILAANPEHDSDLFATRMRKTIKGEFPCFTPDGLKDIIRRASEL